MTLTRLILKNFKSHKNSQIELDQFTCVVGLNGSGKSNILDALCFVFFYPIEYMRVTVLEELRNDINEDTSVYVEIKTK